MLSDAECIGRIHFVFFRQNNCKKHNGININKEDLS